MNNASINFKNLALAWIFIQIIFIIMVVGGGLVLFFDLSMLEQFPSLIGVFVTIIGIIFWALFMYIGYFFKRYNLKYQEFFKRTDIGIVRSFHRFSYYLLIAFPLNALSFLLKIDDVSLIQINAALALPFCIWGLVVAILFYVNEKGKTFDIGVE